MAKADGMQYLPIAIVFTRLTFMLAFDNAVTSETPFEAVIHTASPYHFHAKDAKELQDPGEYPILEKLEESEHDKIVLAIIRTTGILKSVQKYAPSVKRVVVTSSFAPINNVYAKAKAKYTRR
jgi:hypothetical protein